MAELADALDLGSSAARRRGSSPLSRTQEHFWAADLTVAPCSVESVSCDQKFRWYVPLGLTINDEVIRAETLDQRHSAS